MEGLGTLKVDTAFGGDSFVLADARTFGFAIKPDEAREIALTGMKITSAANEQLPFSPPQADWNHISFCFMTGPLEETTGLVEPQCLRRAAWQDRPLADRHGLLGADGGAACQGPARRGRRFIGRSIIETRFDCRIVEETQLAGRSAIVPEISGRAWITGTQQLMLDPEDPFQEGYRIADTWPSVRPRHSRT